MQSISHNYDKKFRTLTIYINGNFDFSIREGFRESFENADKNTSKVIVDLRNTVYMDSSALGMLLILKDVFSNVDIKIINTTSAIKEILKIANFHNLFEVH